MIMVKSAPTLKHVFERLIKSRQRRELFGTNAKNILDKKKKEKMIIVKKFKLLFATDISRTY